MPTHYRHAQEYLRRLLNGRSLEEGLDPFAPRTGPPQPGVSGGTRVTVEAIEQRWGLRPGAAETRSVLADAETLASAERYQHNIENFIGTVKLPVGLAGPLRVNGLFAQGDYAIPLATTEAALVASYHRGAQLISEGGACSAILLDEAVGRAPTSPFLTLAQLSMA